MTFDAGVVERAIETAIGADGGCDHGLHIGALGDIGLDQLRTATRLVDFGDHRFTVGYIDIGDG